MEILIGNKLPSMVEGLINYLEEIVDLQYSIERYKDGYLLWGGEVRMMTGTMDEIRSYLFGQVLIFDALPKDILYEIEKYWGSK